MRVSGAGQYAPFIRAHEASGRSRPLKIAIWHNLPSGGAKRALHDQVRGLLERGHVIESWCPPSADQTYLPLSELIPEHVVSLRWAPSDSKRLLNRFIGPYRDITSLLRAMEIHGRACAEQINAGGFDVLFGGACQFFRVTSIAQVTSIPTVLYLPEPFRWLYEALPQLPWLARPKATRTTPLAVYRMLKDMVRVHGLRIQAREEVNNARAYDRVLVNSLFSRESVLRAYGLDATVCYLGVDTTRFVDMKLPREPFVISVGALLPEKNPRFIIEAVSKVGEPRPPLIWVANDAATAYANDIKALAASVGVRFELRVRARDAELIELLNRAAALLYAPRLEPFGLVPLEANACGLPVIAVAEGGVRETIVDGVNGLLVDATPHAMAAALRQLLSDPEHARRLGEAAMRFVSDRWSLPAALDRLEEQLKLIATRPR